MAHVRQSRPDYGLGFQVKVLKPFQVVPSSLGSGRPSRTLAAGWQRSRRTDDDEEFFRILVSLVIYDPG